MGIKEKAMEFEGVLFERWFLFPTNLIGHYSSFRGPFHIMAAGQESLPRTSANFHGTCVSMFASATVRAACCKICFREYGCRKESQFK